MEINEASKNNNIVIAKCVNDFDRWHQKKESALTIGERYIVEGAFVLQSSSCIKLKGFDKMFNSVLFHFYINEQPFDWIREALPFWDLHTGGYEGYKGKLRIVKYRSATEESLKQIIKECGDFPVIDRSTVG